MTKDELTEAFVKELSLNQTLNGIDDSTIDENTKPIGELYSFDSLTAIEVLASLEVLIESELNIECELDVSLFFTDKGRSALVKKALTHNSLTVSEICNNIYKNIKR